MLMQIYDDEGTQLGLYEPIKGNTKTANEIQQDIDSLNGDDKDEDLEGAFETIGLDRVFVDAELFV